MKKIRDVFEGILTLILVGLYTFLLSIPIYIALAFYLVIPLKKPRDFLKKRMLDFAKLWVSVNSFFFDTKKNIQIDITANGDLSLKKWYLLIANHQSAADILILQYAFNKRAPFLKFLIKKQLVYVPLFGLIWWALDYPLLKRNLSKSGKKNRDFTSTQMACQKFRISPVTVVNFIEGTRYTEKKRIDSKSPYKNLLAPRPGTSAIILSELQDIIHAILDVTIKYENHTTIWSLLCGKAQKIHVNIDVIPLSEFALNEKIMADKTALAQYRNFIHNSWEKKDQLLTNTKEG